MLRQWCQKNSNDPDIASAIRAWLEIVVDDTDFVIPLQSLRQISKTIINVPLVERRDLINQIKIPKITSVESPKEEWIGLRANLAEATRDLDMEVACGELEAIYDDIISKVVELDEKTYCFSLLNLTLTRSFPEEKELLQKTSEKFSTSLYELLEHSAEHFAPLRSVLRVLTNIDPQAANIVASELNTAQRRIAAFSTILDNMLQEQAKSNVSSAIHDALEQLGGLDESSRDDVLIEGTYTMIQHSEAVSDENLGTLFKHAQKVRDWKIRSRLSMNLAVLYSQSNKQTDTLIDQAIQDWHNIDDLNVRISVGFEIVEQLALIDNDRAMDFFTKVQDLYLEAGSSLATGTLGVTYIDGIKLAIRAINTRDLETLDQINRQIQSHIERIPSRRVRVQLIATLAARNYCLGHGEGANDIVRTKILPQIRQLSSGFEKDELIEFCLPVIFEYDSTEAENFAENLFMSAKNRSWSRAINWFVSRAFLYDLHSYYDNESVLDVNDYPRLRLAAQAIKHLTYDYFVYQGIRRVCQAVVVSFDEGKINSTQALSVLNMLEIYIQDRHKLPDKENIKHEGYVILVESCIHGVLSKISLKDKRIRQKSDITDRWKNIHSRAQQIPNAADRIFVMALIARDWCQFLKKNRERHPIEQMLTDAVNQIDTIPTLMDRIERLEIISNSWQEIGQKERAISVLRTVVQMIGRLSLVEKDERIATIIQIAYKLDPDFAAEINSTLDTRKPKSAIDPLHVTTQREKLVREPSRLDRLHQSSGARGIILGSTSRKLLADFATGRGVTHSTSTLMKWLAACQDHNPQVIADVLEWVVESLRRSQPENFCRDVINTCLAVSDLAYNLSGLITSDQRAGIPAGLQDNFSGFESKYICFQTGEADRAKTWLQNWIQKNTEKYLKICDPYFGLEQMDYLKFVPSDCLVWIITTDKCLGSGLDGEQLKKEIEAQWRKISSSMMPLTTFLVIPANCEDKFHDRAIISMSAGLDLGQSLNGVGKSRGKVNILIEYEAKELENTYVDPMLQTTNWFNQGVKAIIFQIGT